MTVQLAMEPPTDDRAGFAYPLDQAAHRVRMAQRELAEAADVLERYSDASNIAQRSIARRLHTEAGYLAGTLTASAERFAAEHPDAHCAQEDTAR